MGPGAAPLMGQAERHLRQRPQGFVQAKLQRPRIGRERGVHVSGKREGPRRAQHLGGLGVRAAPVVAGVAGTGQQRRHGNHVLPVVGHHRHQLAGVAGAEIAKVDLGNLMARYIERSLNAEDLALEGAKITARELVAPQTACGVQEVQRAQGVKGRAGAIHDEARAQQRQVEALAVEAHRPIEPRDQAREVRHHGRLVGVIAHEVLLDPQRAVLQPAAPDQERVGARPAGQAGRLRVDEQRLGQLEILKVRVAGERRQGASSGGVGPSRRQPARQRVTLTDDEERPGVVGLERAADEVLDRNAGCGGSRHDLRRPFDRLPRPLPCHRPRVLRHGARRLRPKWPRALAAPAAWPPWR